MPSVEKCMNRILCFKFIKTNEIQLHINHAPNQITTFVLVFKNKAIIFSELLANTCNKEENDIFLVYNHLFRKMKSKWVASDQIQSEREENNLKIGIPKCYRHSIMAACSIQPKLALPSSTTYPNFYNNDISCDNFVWLFIMSQSMQQSVSCHF